MSCSISSRNAKVAPDALSKAPYSDNMCQIRLKSAAGDRTGQVRPDTSPPVRLCIKYWNRGTSEPEVWQLSGIFSSQGKRGRIVLNPFFLCLSSPGSRCGIEADFTACASNDSRPFRAGQSKYSAPFPACPGGFFLASAMGRCKF